MQIVSSVVQVEEVDLQGRSFSALADYFSSRPNFALLDSRGSESEAARFSFFSFAPFAWLRSKGGQAVLSFRDGGQVLLSDPFHALREVLREHRVAVERGTAPFWGGAIGYVSYEFGRQIEVLPSTVVDDLDLPDYYLPLYSFAVVLSHETGRVSVCRFDPGAKYQALSMDEILTEIDGARGEASTPQLGIARRSISAGLTKDQYFEAVGRIKQYIYAGDVYQVNMTQRFQADVSDLSPWHLYKRLTQINPAPFSAYLNCGDHFVVCSSPERFLRVEGRSVETRPIKGTVRRGTTAAEDERLRDWLVNSPKNRAELAMIVDLLRNDLGRVCVPGSVRVRAFPQIESYASLHHLSATITGELREGSTVVDLLRAAFPGGSITGAPKVRAMEIIDELEPVARGIYTGSIGYIGFNDTADLNIAIRTIIVKNGKAYVHAGGGVVADSDEQEEYEESLLKAAKLCQAIEEADLPAPSGALSLQ